VQNYFAASKLGTSNYWWVTITGGTALTWSEVEIIRRRLSSNGVASTSTKSNRHLDRLRKGGLIHVNVFA
jgi:hypothetical protein